MCNTATPLSVLCRFGMSAVLADPVVVCGPLKWLYIGPLGALRRSPFDLVRVYFVRCGCSFLLFFIAWCCNVPPIVHDFVDAFVFFLWFAGRYDTIYVSLWFSGWISCNAMDGETRELTVRGYIAVHWVRSCLRLWLFCECRRKSSFGIDDQEIPNQRRVTTIRRATGAAEAAALWRSVARLS